jgi:hypothetical protein
MVKVFMIMHHIALYTPCVALVNCGHLLHIRWIMWSRRRKIKWSKSNGCSEIPKYQVARILTLLRIKTSPDASNHIPLALVIFISYLLLLNVH